MYSRLPFQWTCPICTCYCAASDESGLRAEIAYHARAHGLSALQVQALLFGASLAAYNAEASPDAYNESLAAYYDEDSNRWELSPFDRNFLLAMNVSTR